MISYYQYARMAADSDIAGASGVTMRSSNFFFKTRVFENLAELEKMENIMRSGVHGFRHDERIVQECGVSSKWKDAYGHLAPVIDTDRAMMYLLKLVEAKGAVVHSDQEFPELLNEEQKLLKDYEAQAIVNATGLGARKTASDTTVYALRGALVRLVLKNCMMAPGQSGGGSQAATKVTKALSVSSVSPDSLSK
jgi:D-amino-acid oxidase